MSLSLRQLLGQDEGHLVSLFDGVQLQPECCEAFLKLQRSAREQGFDLRVASAFRSFDRQLEIWNAKARGERPVLNDAGKAVCIANLSTSDRVHAILRYSALPGSSRHHWGTDVDVFDAAAVPPGYQLQLSPQEVADDGLFGRLHCWLDDCIEKGQAQGFFRPYALDRGGVAPERWHLSFAPLAGDCASALTPQLLLNVLSATDLELREEVIGQLPDLFARYCCVP